MYDLCVLEPEKQRVKGIVLTEEQIEKGKPRREFMKFIKKHHALP